MRSTYYPRVLFISTYYRQFLLYICMYVCMYVCMYTCMYIGDHSFKLVCHPMEPSAVHIFLGH